MNAIGILVSLPGVCAVGAWGDWPSGGETSLCVLESCVIIRRTNEAAKGFGCKQKTHIMLIQIWINKNGLARAAKTFQNPSQNLWLVKS